MQSTFSEVLDDAGFKPILGGRKRKSSSATGARPGRPKLRSDRPKARRSWNYLKTQLAKWAGPRRAVCGKCQQVRSEFVCVCGYGIMHHRVFNFPGVAVCSEPDCACRGSPAPATAACGMFRAGHDTPEDMACQPVCIPCFDAAPVRPTNQSCDCRLPNIERDGHDFRNMVPRLLEGVHDMIKTVCGRRTCHCS